MENNSRLTQFSTKILSTSYPATGNGFCGSKKTFKVDSGLRPDTNKVTLKTDLIPSDLKQGHTIIFILQV